MRWLAEQDKASREPLSVLLRGGGTARVPRPRKTLNGLSFDLEAAPAASAEDPPLPFMGRLEA